VIVAAGRSASEPESARIALAELCQTYWAPLYAFVRSRGYSMHDGQDLTQSFFAYLIEREIYAHADRAKGRFRSFLLAALKNFLADAYDHAHRLKRGGGQDFLPLDGSRVEAAESLFQTHCSVPQANSEDHLFERTWAEALVGACLKELTKEYQADGRQALLQELQVFLTGSAEPLPTYEDLALKTGTSAPTLRSHVTRLRTRYRELLRAAVRQTVETEAEVEEELHELFRVLTGR
jgi:RNA polymerase sigma-70 factor (ECF subfamily)